MNTETVSEKPRRGRPPSFVPEADAAIHAVWQGQINTRRTLRNKQYMVLAVRAISPDGKRNARYGWLAGDGKNHRQAILVELGRIAGRYGDATAVAMADELASQVKDGNLSNTREAAAWLRRRRLSAGGKPSTATSSALEDLITTTIINYLGEHPDATAALVQEALCGAYSFAERLADMEKTA